MRESRDADDDARRFPSFHADLACCVDVGHVNFALVVERRDGLPVMKPVVL
jgi:hypothetical protein